MCTKEPMEIHPKDRAAEYRTLGALSQESLWKRRALEWKVNFGLWTALGVVAWFVNSQQITVSWVAWPFIALWYLLIFIAHIWFLLICFASDEMDLDWMVYCIQQAEIILGTDIPEKDLRHPQGMRRWDYLKNRDALLKYSGHLSGVLVTLALMVAGLILFWPKT